jgi:hypothetical protein
MPEPAHRALLPKPVFIRRLAKSLLASLAMILISLAAGMAGYHWFESMSWIDAFANAAMILSGMGPLEPLHTDAGKIFAGFYALFSGLALIGVAGIMFAPVIHRFLHRFHMDEDSRTGK